MRVLQRGRVVVLRAPQVDYPCADLHPVQFAEGVLGARVIDVLAEAEATGVGLACFLDQVERLQTPVSLQQVFDLVFIILLGKSADEEFTWTVIHLS